MSEAEDRKKLERLWRKEEKRLLGILERAPLRRRDALLPTVRNVAWMKVQLDRAMELIGTEPIVTEYDNGGGQSGIREHPAFKAYEALWKAYVAGLGKLLEAIPAGQAMGGEPEEPEPAPAPPQTVLELIRARHERGA